MDHICILRCLIIAAGYATTVATSGLVVRYFVGDAAEQTAEGDPESPSSKCRFDTGAIIGKCENLLTITLILADAFTGLALIFTAKSIVRTGSIKRNPAYYLGGTLVNFTYSVLMGFLIRTILSTVDCPA